MNRSPTLAEALATFRKTAKRHYMASIALSRAVELALTDSPANVTLTLSGNIVADAAAIETRSERLLDQANATLAESSQTNAVRLKAEAGDSKPPPTGISPVASISRGPAALSPAGQAAALPLLPPGRPLAAVPVGPVPVGAKRAAPTSPTPLSPSSPARPAMAAPSNRREPTAEDGSPRKPLTNPQQAMLEVLVRMAQRRDSFAVDSDRLAELTGHHRSYVLTLLSTLKRGGYVAWQWRDSERWITLLSPPAELVARARHADAPIDIASYSEERDGPRRLWPVVGWLREQGDHIAWSSAASRYGVGSNYARATPQDLLRRANIMRKNRRLEPFAQELADGPQRRTA